MTDLFAEDVSVDDFALPDDADRIAYKNAQAAAAEGDDERGVVREAESAPEAPKLEDLPRNADGTFAPRADEPEPVSDVEVVEPNAAEKLLAGNFKTTEELERAYEELRSLNGRQSSELGELRRAFEDRFAQIDQRLATPVAPPVQITSDLIEQNPAYAAQLAFEQDNGTAFAIAFEQWKEEDPFGAGSWANSKETERQIAEVRAEHAAQLAAVQSQLGPVAQSAQAAQISSLVASVPGLSEFVASDKIAEIAQEFPEVAHALVTGTPEQKFRSIQTLHQIANGRNSDNLKVTTEQVGRATAEEAQRVREESFVASATTASSGVKPSKADAIAAEWDAMDKPYNDGWQV